MWERIIKYFQINRSELHIGIEERFARLTAKKKNCIRIHLIDNEPWFHIRDIASHILERPDNNIKRDLSSEILREGFKHKRISNKEWGSAKIEHIMMPLEDICKYFAVHDPVLKAVKFPEENVDDDNLPVVQNRRRVQLIYGCFSNLNPVMLKPPFHELVEFLWGQFLELEGAYKDATSSVIEKQKIREIAQTHIQEYHSMSRRLSAFSNALDGNMCALGCKLTIQAVCKEYQIPHAWLKPRILDLISQKSNEMIGRAVLKRDVLIWCTNPSNYECVDLDTLLPFFISDDKSLKIILDKLPNIDNLSPTQVICVKVPMLDSNGQVSFHNSHTKWAVSKFHVHHVLKVLLGHITTSQQQNEAFVQEAQNTCDKNMKREAREEDAKDSDFHLPLTKRQKSNLSKLLALFDD